MNKRAKLSHGTQVDSTDEHGQRLISLITYFPSEIIVNILLKLSTKSLILCKCVCKTLHDLISDSDFVELHLAQSKTCPLVRDMYPSHISRTLYLIEPENGRDFDSGYCWFGKDNPCPCPANKKVNSKLKIPVRKAQEILDEVPNNIDPNVITFTSKIISKSKLHLVKVSPEIHKYMIVNSCNGLLCLMGEFDDHPTVVCNPIIGQFIYLPNVTVFGRKFMYMDYIQEFNANKSDRDLAIYGLGFSPKSNQYKVIRIIVNRYTNRDSGFVEFSGATTGELYTIGTQGWRSINLTTSNVIAPLPNIALGLNGSFATYHCGALHGALAYSITDSNCLVFSVDLDKEQCYLRTITVSQHNRQKGRMLRDPNLVMGVLGDCLCLYDNFGHGYTDIWVMKEINVWESWTRLFSINVGNGFYQPISYLKNGALLMFNSFDNKLIYFHPLEGFRFKYLKISRLKSKFEVIAYIPSLVSLKDILMGSNIEVLNVNSRCGKLKFLEEANPFFLGRSKS